MKINLEATNTFANTAEVGIKSSGWRGLPIKESEITFTTGSNEFASTISVEKVVIVANEYGEYPTMITIKSPAGEEVLPVVSVPYVHKLEKPINALSFTVTINSYEGAFPS